MNAQYLVIENAQLVLENGILWDGVLLIRDDEIIDFGSKKEVYIPDTARRMNADGFYVGPGFIDIHVHGGNGFLTYHDPKQSGDFFLSHGTTSFLSSPPYSLSFQEYLDAIKTVNAYYNTVDNLLGLYMEGPYTNPKYGAFYDINPWRGPIDPNQYRVLVEEAGNLAKVWCIAPERPDIIPFLQYARKVYPETIFAIGHSEATPAQIRSLGRFRPTIQTHFANATGRIPVYGGTRGYGPDEYCMKEDEVFTELISDSCGIHVHPELQQLLLHNKGISRILLVTDSTVYDGTTSENLSHVIDLNFDHNGGIAGSKMTMDQACRNIMTHTNCGIAQAFLMASTNPARALGLDHEIGSIAIGKKANLVFVDDKFNVQQVILNGKACLN